MLTKELIKFNISILKVEKRKLEIAIEAVESEKESEKYPYRPKTYKQDKLKEHKGKIVKIDRILEHYNSLLNEKKGV